MVFRESSQFCGERLMAVKVRTDCEEMEWSAEEEIQLFKALGGLKPIGINKHFYMACICERLSTALKREITPDVVWAHLKTMYNLEILDQLEPVPFPQDQCDFQLPEAEFSALMSKKLADIENGGATAAAAAAGEGSSSVASTTAVAAAAVSVAIEPEDEMTDVTAAAAASAALSTKCKLRFEIELEIYLNLFLFIQLEHQHLNHNRRPRVVW